MILFRTSTGPVVEHEGRACSLERDWDELLNADDLEAALQGALRQGRKPVTPSVALAPIVGQEVWAAGVTYWRSRDARMEESKDSGGGSFYDRVYEAERPELFFKATPRRVAGPGGLLRLRKDSRWMVPEPELTLCVNRRAEIIGYTIGNDLSCRDIEGENPLYLPQAKVFDGCAALGPGILVTREPLPKTTAIRLRIKRGGSEVAGGETTLAQLRREPSALVAWLFRETSFPEGVFLLTGTGIVPKDDFTLQPGDEISIEIPPIGTLVNSVA